MTSPARGYRRQAGSASSQGKNAMGLPAIEQRVLDTIENDLQVTDLQLAAAFAAFTRFASGTRMPRPERLTAWHRLITRLRCSHPNAGR